MSNFGNKYDQDCDKNQSSDKQHKLKGRRRSANGKVAVGALVGGVAIGVAVTGAFVAGHVCWPSPNASGSADTVPLTGKLLPAAGMAIGENTIADVAEAANKSVVNIDTRRSVTVSDSPFFGIPFGGPMEFFFGQGMGEGMPVPRKMESKGRRVGIDLSPRRLYFDQ